MRGISIFLDQLAEHCPDIASVWLIGARADDDTLDSRSHFGWDLVAFADDATLHRLRRATELHRDDICLRVVTDGDHFAPAWGDRSRAGTLSRWRWRAAGEREASFAQARRPHRAIRLQSRI